MGIKESVFEVTGALAFSFAGAFICFIALAIDPTINSKVTVDIDEYNAICGIYAKPTKAIIKVKTTEVFCVNKKGNYEFTVKRRNK